jgi:hypothetical protein
MTSCIGATGTCTCVICGGLVSNMSTRTEYPSLPPRLGTRFTPGVGEIPVDDTKDSIPFQDLSKLAKRMDWAVVKMTNE